MKSTSTRPGEDRPELYALIGLLAAGVFGLDVALNKDNLGTAVWVFYFVPLILSLRAPRPSAPVMMGFICSALIGAGYFVSEEPPHQILVRVARINRSLGVASLLALGLIGRQFVASRIALELRDWIKAGQAEVSKRMAGPQPAGELARNILSSLARHVGALVGSVYFTDQGGRYAWKGGYGLAAPRENHDVVGPGQTLVGQAAVEGRILVVNDVPEGYADVRSGVGAARPRTLVLVPIRAEQVTTGVIELGFFAPPPAETLELLEAVSETVGFSIRALEYRELQSRLLAETQQQAEELQAQQKELATSNEELTSQQEELRQANETLAEQARLLERASRYKSEFLANMSHELRTPLNSSLILAKLLADNRERNLSAEQVRYAQSIYSAGNDLLALINDILDLSKIEAGKVQLDTEPVPVARIARDLQTRFDPLAAQKGLAFSVTISPGCPEIIHTDLQRIRQILTNLLSNAVKFTERGSVQLHAEAPDPRHIAFTVKDTGIGIPADKHEVIFEAFRQADGTTSRKFGGTGLGLSICRDLAALLGGQIRLRSAPGEGSAFTVSFPLRPLRQDAAVPAQPRLAMEAPRPQRSEAAQPARPFIADDRGTITAPRRVVLVVEDDPTFAQILRDLARELRFQCIAAGSANEALLLAREHHPVAVILDIGLPDQSGLSVLELLKRDPATRHVPIHVISAHDYEQVAREMGAVGYALKPIKREEIVAAFRMLEEHLSRRTKSLLLVEDDPVQRDALAKLLGADGVHIVSVTTADEALAQLRAGTFECVVLDLMLPGVSGFELLDRMSADASCSYPPVIVYTARPLDRDEEHKLRRLSKSIIVKGARSPERLLEEVTLFLHQAESDLSADKQRMLRTARDREVIFEGRRILLVEDDVRNVFALTSVLQSRGATVEIARNGVEALAKLDGGPSIDLLLMDIMMPEMDGLEAMRRIRRSEKWSAVPIIALTAKAMPDDREQCLAAGANDYIAKPIDVEKLLSLLRVWMPR